MIRGRRARKRALAAARTTAAAELADREAALEAAVAAYSAARTRRGDVAALRAAHRAADAAYRDAIVAAERAERFAPGTVSTRIGQLRTALEVHVLEATSASGILVPTCVRVSSRAALGPRVAGLVGSEDPYGPVETRVIGVDLWAAPDPTPDAEEMSIRLPVQRTSSVDSTLAAA